jgi:hypothetical protein
MITCVLKGGLGNQLFQIFAIIAYGIRNNHPFLFKYDTHVNIGAKRRLYWNDFLVSLKNMTTFNKYYGVTNEDLEQFPTVYLSHHHYQIMPMILDGENVKFDSYFQSYLYFEEEKTQIFSLIRLESQLQIVKNNYPELLNDRYTISMHFRLGDYKHLQDHHNILPFEYYKKSIDHIVSELRWRTNKKKVRILYFCEEEDRDTVLQMVVCLEPLYPNIEFMNVKSELDDWQQMLLMACCNSNIMANSSFSWWGAYLNQNDEKMVCYPSIWFGPQLRHNIMKDMFPNALGWMRIEF